MSVLRYRLAQTFLRREAVPANSYAQNVRGGARNEPADPLTVGVLLTAGADRTQLIESITTPHPRLYRLTTGTWGYDIPCELLQPTQAYAAAFIYQFQGGNQQASFQTFNFNPVPTPHTPGNCVVYGMLADANGIPYGNEQVVVERFADVVTLNQRIDVTTVRSDAFGLWWLELPPKTVIRVVLGELTKVIAVPPLDRAALGDIPAWSPSTQGNVDRFGYPKP